MISEILIFNLFDISKRSIKINFDYFIKLNHLISDKIVRKIYEFFNNGVALRSEKIKILINQINQSKFKVFNLKGMMIRKVNDSLIFSKKPN